jgi:hypothetical protein
VTTPMSGWQHLNKPEHDEVWELFERRFEFRASTDSAHWPGIAEPIPSLTWDLAIIEDDRDVLPRWQRIEVDDDGLNHLIMSALQDCLRADEWVYALDWQHPGYHCWPHRVNIQRATYRWPVEVFPNGDYHIFASRDLTFGSFGHPWEATLCLWGGGSHQRRRSPQRRCPHPCLPP